MSAEDRLVTRAAPQSRDRQGADEQTPRLPWRCCCGPRVWRRFEISIAEFERALGVCPQRAQISLALGEAQLMAGRLEASLESLGRAVKLDPKNVTARKVLGDALYLKGREAEAEGALKAALALDPKFEPAQ